MIPLKTIKDLISKHTVLEKELSSGDVDKKLFAEKSKEYSDLNDVIDDAKKYFSYEKTIKNACPKAHPVLLEPMMKLEVITPEINMGDVVADLNKRRGLMEGMDDKNGAKVVKAKVPLSEMFGYVTSLRTITSGRATSTMEFSHFAEAPQAVAKNVIAKAKGQVEA